MWIRVEKMVRKRGYHQLLVFIFFKKKKCVLRSALKDLNVVAMPSDREKAFLTLMCGTSGDQEVHMSRQT